jgi:hypothetical protein
MAFIQPCFIQKCTPALIEALVGIGYKTIGKITLSLGGYGIFCNNGKIKICSTNEQPSIKDKDFIQCYDNENLFLALASMTDDEHGLCDYYIVTTDGNPRYAKGSIHRALPISSVIHPSCYRKATVEELIEHFKKE